MSNLQIFVSYDTEHDRPLYERLLAESRVPSSGFAVQGSSERTAGGDAWLEKVRRRIRAVDQVIVICGEHTDESTGVRAELQIAQQERTPYFLLWGRREIMCTKPTGARPAEGIYSWTRQVLHDQITLTSRKIGADVAAEIQRSATRKP